MMKARIFPLEADVCFSDEVATVTEVIQTENAASLFGESSLGKLLKLIITPMDKILG